MQWTQVRYPDVSLRAIPYANKASNLASMEEVAFFPTKTKMGFLFLKLADKTLPSFLLD
jgi:phenylpropionate dioxygenase-like ring-hydroxylating dioxygenase large terminal subunit